MADLSPQEPEPKTSLSKQERRVSALAEQDPLRFATSTAAEIAELTSTSEATVARTARKLGFAGTKEMKLACASQVDRTQSLGDIIRSRLATLPSDSASAEPARTTSAVLSSAADLLLKLNDSLSDSQVSAAVEELGTARRVVVYGLGTAFHIAQYFCLELERVGIEAHPLTGSGHSLADAIPRLRPDDALIVVAPLMIFTDVRNFLETAAPKVATTTVLTQDELPTSLHGRIRRIGLPQTRGGAASESVTAWALCDVLVAEIARQRPERAIEYRNYVQQLRERFSPE